MSEDMCELCESIKAAVICLDCKVGKKLCPDCYRTTHHGDNKRNHKIQMVDSKTEMSSYTDVLSTMSLQFNCAIHTKKTLEYVCRQCDKAICCDCLLVGAHKGHDAMSFDEACSVLHEKFVKVLQHEEEQKASLEETKVRANKKIQEREEMYSKWIDTVTTEFKIVHEALKEKEQEILQILDEEKQREYQQYEKIFEQINKQQEENQIAINSLQEIIKEKMSPHVYQMRKDSAQHSTKERKIEIEGAFENNRTVNFNTEELVNTISDVFSFEEKKPPTAPKAKHSKKKRGGEPEKAEEEKAGIPVAERPPAKETWYCEKCHTENPKGVHVCSHCGFQNKIGQKRLLYENLRKIAELEKSKLNIPALCPLPNFFSFDCQFCGKKNTDKLTKKCSYCQKMNNLSPEKK